jgi:hypothetical protein
MMTQARRQTVFPALRLWAASTIETTTMSQLKGYLP